MKIQSYNLDQGGNVELMRKVIQAQGQQLDEALIKDVFHYAKPGDTMQALVEDIGNWAYQNAYFYPDTDVQTIRTKQAFLNHRKANCVDYTVMICSIAKMVGLKSELCLVAEDGENFLHVVPVIEGIICDVVPLQNQDGSESETRMDEKGYIVPIQTLPEGSKTLFFQV